MCLQCLLQLSAIRLCLMLGVLRHPSYRRDIVKRLMNSAHSPNPAAADGQITLHGEQATDGSLPLPPRRLVVLVRHGQTTFNMEGRLPGQLAGIPLTDEGRRQAHRAAVALSAMPLSAVLTSPLERARHTADIIANGWGLEVRTDPRLLDTDVSRWAGRKIDEVAKSDPAWKTFLERPDEPPEGVESLSAVQTRAIAVGEDVRRDAGLGEYVVLVAHADVVKLILAHYTGIPLHGARHISIANASISALAFAGVAPAQLLAMNWTPAPGWLVPPLTQATQPAEHQAQGDESVDATGSQAGSDSTEVTSAAAQ